MRASAAVCGLLLVVGCAAPATVDGAAPRGPGEPSPSGSSVPRHGAVVPWQLRLAAPQPVDGGWPFDQPASGLPACQPDQLNITSTVPTVEPAGDSEREQVGLDLVVENTGAPCQLEPEAEGRVDGEQGRLPLPTNVGRGGPASSPPPPLQTGGTASTRLIWSSWCGEDPGRWRAVLTLAGQELKAPAVQEGAPVPGCLPKSDGALYGFGVWTILDEQGQPARDPQSALVGTVTGPDEAPLLGVLPMVLRLHNPTRGPISLTPCPRFTWSVAQTGPGSYFRASPELELNCPDAPAAVPAGGSVSFALELTLSTAIADGALAPGRWFVTPGLGGAPPRPIRVLPPQDEPDDQGDATTCEWIRQPGSQPRVPGLPDTTAPREDKTAVVSTDRGDITIALDARRAPCAVAALTHLVQGGFWTDQPCYQLSIQPVQFRNLDCGVRESQPLRAGFAFPSEARPGQSYPAGTVVLTSSETLTSAGSIRILFGDATTYLDSFVILGQVTNGLDIVEKVAAGGQKDGDFNGPALPLHIEQVTVA